MQRRDNRGIIHACVRACGKNYVAYLLRGVTSPPGHIPVYDADASLKMMDNGADEMLLYELVRTRYGRR